MRKHLVAIFLVTLFATMSVLSVHAATGFDGTVLKNAPDVVMSTYEESGTAYTIGSLSETTFNAKDSALKFGVDVLQDDTAEGYMLNVCYGAYDLLGIKEIKVNINNTIYTFSNPIIRISVVPTKGQAIVLENATIIIGEESLAFMQDLIDHRNESITMQLVADERICSFEVPVVVKDSMIHMYNLYVQAGGTRTENLKNLKATTVKIEKPAA